MTHLPTILRNPPIISISDFTTRDRWLTPCNTARCGEPEIKQSGSGVVGKSFHTTHSLKFGDNSFPCPSGQEARSLRIHQESSDLRRTYHNGWVRMAKSGVGSGVYNR